MKVDGPAVLTALTTAGPFTVDELRDYLRPRGYACDTANGDAPARLFYLLAAMGKAGRIVCHEGYWATSVVTPTIIRVDKHTAETLTAIADGIRALIERRDFEAGVRMINCGKCGEPMAETAGDGNGLCSPCAKEEWRDHGTD